MVPAGGMSGEAMRDALAGPAVRLEWDRGRAEVRPLGAALHELEFVLGDGRAVSPLAEAPWQCEADTLADASIPAHLRHLGGEWPCVPFGRGEGETVTHGFGTDNRWRLVASRPESCDWEIAYPPDHAVERLRRTVAGIPGRAEIACTLTVLPRRDCVLPLGLHPILKLPEPGEAFRVDGAFSHGETFPVTFEAGVSRLAPGRRFASLDALPLAKGGAASLSELCGMRTEEAFQLFGVSGELRLLYERHSVRLAWNAADFPTCLFWLSAAGRGHKPWGGRFRGLGVEPLAATFEARDGQGAIVGAKAFQAGRAWTTSYRLAADAGEAT